MTEETELSIEQTIKQTSAWSLHSSRDRPPSPCALSSIMARTVDLDCGRHPVSVVPISCRAQLHSIGPEDLIMVNKPSVPLHCVIVSQVSALLWGRPPHNHKIAALEDPFVVAPAWPRLGWGPGALSSIQTHQSRPGNKMC